MRYIKSNKSIDELAAAMGSEEAKQMAQAAQENPHMPQHAQYRGPIFGKPHEVKKSEIKFVNDWTPVERAKTIPELQAEALNNGFMPEADLNKSIVKWIDHNGGADPKYHWNKEELDFLQELENDESEMARKLNKGFIKW